MALGDVFAIDQTDLSSEMARQASLYAYFTTQKSYAERALARAALQKDGEYAVADDHYRKSLVNAGEKFTEAKIRSYVLQDEDYHESAREEIRAKSRYTLLRAICQALEMRSNMLVSLGAHIRHELDMTSMNIRERRFGDSVASVKSAITAARELYD